MEKRGLKRILYPAIFLTALCGTFAACYAYGRDVSETIRAVVSSGLMAGSLLFMWEDHFVFGDLLCDNGEHPRRFFLAFLAAFSMSLFLPLIVMDAWPMLAVYVLLSLLSSPFVGAVAGTELLLVTVLINGGRDYEFFMYIFSGLTAVALFRKLDEQMHAGLPLFISLMMQTLLLVCYHVMFDGRAFSAGLLIVPLINAFINFVLLIMILNTFSFFVMRKEAERYAEINDPSFALMLRMKEKSADEYQRAIHTDYLTQRAASAIGLNLRAVRSLSYYHRAMVVLEEKDLDHAVELYKSYNFPKEAIFYLSELISHKKGDRISAESTVVSLCETLIAALQFMFKRDKEVKLNYGVLVDKIFDKKEAEGDFAESDLSIRGLRITKELLKKETLYYDFLR